MHASPARYADPVHAAGARRRPFIALLCVAWMLLLGLPPQALAIDDAFAETESQLASAPRSVLDKVQAVLRDQPISDPDRPYWLTLGSEAAYALALPDVAVELAREGLDRPALDAGLRQRLSIAYAQGLDLAGDATRGLEELMTVVATLERGGFEQQLMADALNARASIYYSLGNFRAALADLLRVYPLTPDVGNRSVLADTANSLGNVYAALDDLSHAEQFYREAIERSVANANWVRASIAEYSLASLYRRNERWEDAEHYFAAARDHSLQVDDAQGVAYAEFGLGRVAQFRNDYPRAERMYRQALPLFEQANDLIPQVNVALALAEMNYARKRHGDSLSDVARGLALVEQAGGIDQKFRLLQIRADNQRAMGDYRAAYDSLKTASEAQEKILLARNSESLSEMRVRFDSERQEQQTALLQKENQLRAAQLAEQQQASRLYAVSSAALLVVTSLFVYLAIRSRQVRQKLAAQALTDELTGVANRRAAMRTLEDEFERARRYRTPLAVAVFDIDHFKQINDRFGHAGGDQVLVRFAREMAGRLRKTDAFGRVGGEEFLAVLPHTELNAAVGVMERMRIAATELECPALRGEVHPSVSIGLAAMQPDDASADALIRRADEAVYRAKHEGRNRVVLAEPGANPATEGASGG